MKKLSKFIQVLLILPYFLSSTLYAETIGLFFDSNISQIAFAAGDIKKALESKGYQVEVLGLNMLNANYSNKKIVLSLDDDTQVKNLMVTEGGILPTGLKPQGYGLRTTTTQAKSYWIIGVDANGVMYGGLQIAENINFEGLTGTYTTSEEPKIVRRGIKLNLPLDKTSGTYGVDNSTSKVKGLPHVWDINFWEKWFDTMARNRYNVVSVWTYHPFTSFVKVPGYENCAIDKVTGLDGVQINTMTIDDKIVFWKKVMAYAHSRGFEFYLFNWNLFLENAQGKYGLDGSGIDKGVTSPANIAYMRKSMTTLWETYPDLDGFGITQGEGMSQNDFNDAKFLGDTYGKGTLDYAAQHPERTIRMIHRWHLTDFSTIKSNFKELMELPNITFEMSFKHSLAHMYSLALPDRMQQDEKDALVAAGLKSHLTVRNDDFFYHDWGNPNYARDYVYGMIKRGTEGAGASATNNWLAGFYIGSDSYTPTRTFFSKNSLTQGMLEVDRQWYMNMLWGRLSYNPLTPDSVFTNTMQLKFPTISSSDLFNSWKNVSKNFTDLGELICGTLGRDNQWWPEACQGKDAGNIAPTNKDPGFFLLLDDFIAATPMKGSKIASLSATASGALGGLKSALVVANEMEANGLNALKFANAISTTKNTEAAITIDNIKAMSYLSIYYSFKLKGAIFRAQTKTADAREAMSNAYCWWMRYSKLMVQNFTGMNLARSSALPDWTKHDKSVLKEFTDLGGTGIPSCPEPNLSAAIFDDETNNDISIYPNPANDILNITFNNDNTEKEISIYTILGQSIYKTKTSNNSIIIDVKPFNLEGIIIVRVTKADTIKNYKIIID